MKKRIRKEKDVFILLNEDYAKSIKKIINKKIRQSNRTLRRDRFYHEELNELIDNRKWSWLRERRVTPEYDGESVSRAHRRMYVHGINDILKWLTNQIASDKDIDVISIKNESL